MKRFVELLNEAEKKARPRVFYRGENPGDTRRIKTGDDHWDKHFFVSSNRDSAKMYGHHIRKFEATHDAKILYHGTKEYRSMAKGTGKMNMLQHASTVAKRAKEAGYHAVHFQHQGDVGTAVFDRSKFKEIPDT